MGLDKVSCCTVLDHRSYSYIKSATFLRMRLHEVYLVLQLNISSEAAVSHTEKIHIKA
jgi:hypothetical protein